MTIKKIEEIAELDLKALETGRIDFKKIKEDTNWENCYSEFQDKMEDKARDVAAELTAANPYFIFTHCGIDCESDISVFAFRLADEENVFLANWFQNCNNGFINNELTVEIDGYYDKDEVVETLTKFYNI